MREPRGERPARLDLDPAGFAAVERLASYELGNALLLLNLELQQRFGLRAEDYQVMLLVTLSTVQRFARDGAAERAYFGRAPLPEGMRSSISRRRISETLGIPQETVRRIVARLLARGLIVEPRRGCLSTAGGTLAMLGADATPERVARRILATANALLRQGAARLRPGCGAGE